MLNPISSFKSAAENFVEALSEKARNFASKGKDKSNSIKISENSAGTAAGQPVKGYNVYDTISSAQDDLIESKIDATSKAIDNELKKDKRDFEKLQTLVYNIIMLVMRRAAKSDHEYITEVGELIKKQSVQIKDTYNTWTHLSVTVASSGISLFGGFAGISRFLPANVITPENAMVLSGSALSIGNAGTGLSGIGSMAGSRSEGKRNALQLDLKRIEGKEDDRKGAKQSNKEAAKTARAAHEHFNQIVHETSKAVASAA